MSSVFYSLRSDTIAINGFIGSEFIFLSNFYTLHKPLRIDGRSYISVEHAFQASRTLSEEYRQIISEIPSPIAARKLGRTLHSMKLQRDDWKQVRERIMYKLLIQKFHPEKRKRMAALLNATGAVYLNNKDDYTLGYNPDKFWGTYNNEGKNKLGELLMRVRNFNRKHYMELR